MKNLIPFLLLAFAWTMFSCANTRESTSNTGPDRTSLPTPASNSTVPSSSNVTNTNQNNASTAEKNFWSEAADGGLSEVEMGKMAVKKAQNPEVKKFAQMMLADHTKTSNEIKGHDPHEYEGCCSDRVG